MLFSLNILKELVDIEKYPLDKLVENLTFSGFEVEDVSYPPVVDKLAIGKVIECKAHPDSDHLHVLKVDIGTDRLLDIVCGAPNVRKDLKVILAMVGCVIPTNKMTIKESTIRGAKSEGMCCSLKELGIDDSSFSNEIQNGIFEVDSDIEIGQKDVLHELGFDDIYLDINVLPNRSDCLSYFGMAREISSLTNCKLKFEYNELDVSKLEKLNYKIKSNSDKCQRFSGVELKINSNNFQSPKWLKDSLNKFNIRSISPLVDLGNYVMKLTGQPVHVYDLDKIGNFKTITVEDNLDQDFRALDNQVYKVINKDLAVCFDKKIKCLGGIMGGYDCQVDQNSKRLFIESAHFFHQNVRLTSKRLNLISDSSTFFTKKTNPYLTLNCLNLFISLAKKIFSGVKVVGYADFNKLKKFNNKVSFSLAKLNSRLGSNYTFDEVKNCLLNFDIQTSKTFVNVPITRLDLVEQCDIEEEVFRYYQAKNINLTLKNMPVTEGRLTLEQERIKTLHNRLIDNGLSQAISYTLVSKEMDELVKIFDTGESYQISNPMTLDHAIVRTDLIPSMIETLNYNVNHKNTNLAMYEISQIDTQQGLKTYLCVGLYSNNFNREKLENHKYDYYDLKGILELVMDTYHIEKNRYKLSYSKNQFFHKGISSDVTINNKLVGSFGLISPSFKKIKPYLILELDLTSLSEVKSGQMKMKSISNYPKISRDFAFVINNNNSYAEIKDVIKKAGGSLINSINLFDYFLLKNGEISLGINVEFISYDKTLNDEEIKQLCQKIVDSCSNELHIRLKGENDV